MAMTGVLRPGYVQLRVMDLEAARTHYRDHIGLQEVLGGPKGHALFRCSDEFDHHSVVLRQADSAGMDVMGFKVASEAELDAFDRALSTRGVQTTWLPEDFELTLGRRLRFVAPTGHTFDLYAQMQLSPDAPVILNPDLWMVEPHGMRPQRFDHCALMGKDVSATAALFVEVLGFAVAEELIDPESGFKIGIFLSCSTKAHDLALLHFAEDDRIHHTSFNVESWHDVGHAADVIARYKIPLDIGPTRHGITRGQTIYFFDPSGNRNEIFSGGYSFYPDNPTRRWTVDKAGKAIFYYEQAVHDRFLAVAT
ncbi:catechol 2,3-dioxygenase [Paraburkholderia sp. CNPSo 3076]|uniref:catechol 2,3-dioxygenase n=1 Tax=Paraburkholderia sp. CNPSo 3076 TaxID=2940936 RepID=UPI00225434EF|nr:catechol 2,3-dioxygenase [Paraburkholderia sp. CNPSo 3076]MCX5542122.1 catechol 2,3-dioxygenase [Paraburkholderia sp. CNPSo 3076]